MILYNVTLKVEGSIAHDWLDWMQTVHIPEVMETKCFVEYKISQILQDDGDGGITFAVQYLAPSMEIFQSYQENFAKALQQKHADRFLNQYVAFRTLMKVLDQG